MPARKKTESPLHALSRFLPAGAYDAVAPYFAAHPIHLTLTPHRATLHGDYRAPTREQPYHRITVNATLNPYAFFVTLLHELAHLTTQVQWGRKAVPHGAEWKAEFRKVLRPVIGRDYFPADVERALNAYLQNPAASTCTNPTLFKALSRYDAASAEMIHADEVPVGGRFELNGRTFEKLERLRTRSRCRELGSGKIYFVQGIALVKMVE